MGDFDPRRSQQDQPHHQRGPSNIPNDVRSGRMYSDQPGQYSRNHPIAKRQPSRQQSQHYSQGSLLVSVEEKEEQEDDGGWVSGYKTIEDHEARIARLSFNRDRSQVSRLLSAGPHVTSSCSLGSEARC